jgi:hypothetical protein
LNQIGRLDTRTITNQAILSMLIMPREGSGSNQLLKSPQTPTDEAETVKWSTVAESFKSHALFQTAEPECSARWSTVSTNLRGRQPGSPGPGSEAIARTRMQQTHSDDYDLISTGDLNAMNKLITRATITELSGRVSPSSSLGWLSESDLANNTTIGLSKFSEGLDDRQNSLSRLSLLQSHAEETDVRPASHAGPRESARPSIVKPENEGNELPSTSSTAGSSQSSSQTEVSHVPWRSSPQSVSQALKKSLRTSSEEDITSLPHFTELRTSPHLRPATQTEDTTEIPYSWDIHYHTALSDQTLPQTTQPRKLQRNFTRNAQPSKNLRNSTKKREDEFLREKKSGP